MPLAVPKLTAKFKAGFSEFTLVRESIYWSIIVITAILAVVAIGTKCISAWNPAAYEHFMSQNARDLQMINDRIERVRAEKERLQRDLDDLGDITDDTCSILKMVEERYIGNAMAPTDETEYDLPPAIQKQRQEQRKKRAQERFQQEKKLYAAANKGATVYECFEDAPKDVSKDDLEAAEAILQKEIEELHSLLDSAEVQLSVKRGKEVYSLLGFNAKFLQKGIDAVKPPEGFMNYFTGGTLVTKADALIGKSQAIREQFANVKDAAIAKRKDQLIQESNVLLNRLDTTHSWVQEMKQEVANQKAAALALNKKTSDLQKGKVSDADVANSVGKLV